VGLSNLFRYRCPLSAPFQLFGSFSFWGARHPTSSQSLKMPFRWGGGVRPAAFASQYFFYFRVCADEGRGVLFLGKEGCFAFCLPGDYFPCAFFHQPSASSQTRCLGSANRFFDFLSPLHVPLCSPRARFAPFFPSTVHGRVCEETPSFSCLAGAHVPSCRQKAFVLFSRPSFPPTMVPGRGSCPGGVRRGLLRGGCPCDVLGFSCHLSLVFGFGGGGV